MAKNLTTNKKNTTESIYNYSDSYEKYLKTKTTTGTKTKASDSSTAPIPTGMSMEKLTRAGKNSVDSLECLGITKTNGIPYEVEIGTTQVVPKSTLTSPISSQTPSSESTDTRPVSGVIVSNKNKKDRLKFSDNDDFYHVKIMLIGDSTVGKSSLLLRWTEEVFFPNLMPTIGIDFRVKFVTVKNCKLRVQCWDTAGQERFKVITRAYYRGSMGMLLVFDVTNRASFNNVVGWIKNVHDNTYSLYGMNKEVKFVLIGNKIDLPNRQVTTEEGAALAAKYNCPYFETSAVQSINVSEAFEGLLASVVDEYFTNVDVPNTTPTPGVALNQQTTKSCCF